MAYKIIFSKKAREKYDDILTYYLDVIENPLIASRIIREIDRALKVIGEYPLSSPIVIEQLHKIHLKHYKYKIFYKFEDDSVVVETILHDYQDYERHLKS